MFELVKREITTDYGQEIIVEKKYKLNKDQPKNRLWVMQPQDPAYKQLAKMMEAKGLWK